MANASLRLGLIGGNIAASRAPLLHRLAGAQNGIHVTYDRLTPAELGHSFDQVFVACQTGGYRGVNITYPFKEVVTGKLIIEDPAVRAMRAVNTVVFEAARPKGYNTDHSGFMAAYAKGRGQDAPGIVLLIGTGGVGRAIAHALISLGASELRLVDRDTVRAKALATELSGIDPTVQIAAWPVAEDAARGAQGLVNATPVGMVGHAGTPLKAAAMNDVEWAFDAVYTPSDTEFLTLVAGQGGQIMSGWDLFFYQGIHAWAHFSGASLDADALRAALLADRAEP